ncbi:MAG: YgiQ family radical SAM protein, partial [Fusobacterium sp.]|nr:YgiQ family radical SAM protein [Fusobacterium sp.]
MKFLPTTREEMNKLGWKNLDVLLISGDTYLDTSYNGSALVGKWLVKHGFKVGIIAQPEIDSPVDITRMGEPDLFFAISGGCVDSMVANYTATKKKRQQDDFTPGGINNKRPDRAVLVYSNMIRRFFKGTEKKIVISGIESSLRRITHYDYWTNKLRKPILFDAKADILSYGMGEMSMLNLAKALRNNEDWRNIRGLCYISKEMKEGYLSLPSHKECLDNKDIFAKAFHSFYLNCDPITAKGLIQKCDDRYMIQNPPSLTYSEKEMDEIYSMEFARDVHPYYKKMGIVKALDTIKYSVTTHRGCYGECNFCAIAIHQGRTVMSRSQDSIVDEVKEITNIPKFHGNISDVGGPTANMYGLECKKKLKLGSCPDRRCLYPKKCPSLLINHSKQIELLKKLKEIPKIKKIFIASGIRYDMILDDNKCGQMYLKELVKDHISGQMKIAPEHTEDSILSLMGKDGKSCLNEFKNRFYKLNEELGKKQFLTYYLIADHPGCREKEMMDL